MLDDAEETIMKYRGMIGVAMLVALLVGCGLVMLFSPTAANAWTITQNYDSQPAGATCASMTDTQSIVSAGTGTAGSSACQNRVNKGDTAFGRWGGIIYNPAPLRRGDEVWIKADTYWPAGFNYDSTAEGNRLKFLRLHTMDSGNPNYGYDDLYINPKGSVPPFSFIYEGDQVWKDVGTSADAIQLGRWESYQMYVKLDNLAASKGGMARVRIWKDGKLLKEITDRPTLKVSGAYSDRFHLFTYWNGGSPATQSMYVDNLVITSDTPAGRDAAGNAMIGTAPAPAPAPTPTPEPTPAPVVEPTPAPAPTTSLTDCLTAGIAALVQQCQ